MPALFPRTSFSSSFHLNSNPGKHWTVNTVPENCPLQSTTQMVTGRTYFLKPDFNHSACFFRFIHLFFPTQTLFRWSETFHYVVITKICLYTSMLIEFGIISSIGSSEQSLVYTSSFVDIVAFLFVKYLGIRTLGVTRIQLLLKKLWKWFHSDFIISYYLFSKIANI